MSPRVLTLAEVNAGAERAAARVDAWPEWKRELSSSSATPSSTIDACAACPVEIVMLHAGESPIELWGDARAVLACDPGVQSGWVLAVATCGVVIPIAAALLGQRKKPGRRGVPMKVASPPGVDDHSRVITGLLETYVRSTVLRDVAGGDGPTRPRPVVACEDWFAGVNPGTARDIAQQFYFAEAAAQLHGLTFRAVANQTWKKTYLGRGNMRSDEALLAYAAKGHEAHPHVTRWAGTTVGALGEADDAAALGVAHHWLSTEST